MESQSLLKWTGDSLFNEDCIDSFANLVAILVKVDGGFPVNSFIQLKEKGKVAILVKVDGGFPD